jgi:hypothetical protein
VKPLLGSGDSVIFVIGASAPAGKACTTPWRASSNGSALPGISSEKNSVTKTVSSLSERSRSFVIAIATGWPPTATVPTTPSDAVSITDTVPSV